MRPFGSAKPRRGHRIGRGRTVVRTYGRDSLLGLVNPLLALIVRTFGVQLRLKSEDRVLLEMERDQVAMIRKGYRIVASEQFEMPPFGITWYRVTYELANTPGGPGTGEDAMRR